MEAKQNICPTSTFVFYCGHQMEEQTPEPKIHYLDLIVAFLMPTLVGKVLVLVFGQLYSRFPGEGYGYGLSLAIFFTLAMVARFLWKYR